MANTTRIEHPVSKIDELINKLTNSPINLLHRARKYNKIMQNKPNFKNALIYISACIESGYVNFLNLSRPKNKAKQSQNKPNFDPILALFSPILASVSPMMTINCWRMNERSLNEDN